MGDQNKFEEYRQKLLQYWTAFLTGCGSLWQKIRAGGKKAAQFIGTHAGKLGEYARAWFGRAAAWIGVMIRRLAALLAKAAEFTKEKAKRFAAWLLKVRNDLMKEGSPLSRAKIWCGGIIARLRPPRTEEATKLPQQAESLNATQIEAPALEVIPAEVQPAVVEPVAVEEEVPEELFMEQEPELYETDDSVSGRIHRVLLIIGKWIRRLYKIVMAAPVVYAAVKLALKNMDRLPDLVGLDIQSNGEFSYVITREIAVLGPLALTVFCLALMFCAKKPVLPWVISMFTLVLPLLIWITNLYA